MAAELRLGDQRLHQHLTVDVLVLKRQAAEQQVAISLHVAALSFVIIAKT